MNAKKWIAVGIVALLGVVGVASTQPTTTQAAACKVEETRLGPIERLMDNPVFSQDGHHLAYITRKGAKYVVVVDGQA